MFVILAVGLSWLAVKLTLLWLLVFGALLLAQILRVMAEPIYKYTPVPEGVAIFLALLLLLGGLGLGVYFFGRELGTQIIALSNQIPAAWASLNQKLMATTWGDEVLMQINKLGEEGSKALSIIPSIAQDVLASLTNLLVVVVGGVFIATNAKEYAHGVIRLFPKDQQAFVSQSLLLSGQALRRWLLGQTISMLLVGALITIGMSLLGVPSSMALGLISGVAQFVPVVGPVMATLPGLIMAASSDWHTLVYALLVYTAVSQLEANFITPMVQKSVAEVPVVLTLFAVIGFAMLFGPLGIVFASPLTVVIVTLVRKYYADNNGAPLPQVAPPPQETPNGA
jgi:predicted PurR-regulated permease PerM